MANIYKSRYINKDKPSIPRKKKVPNKHISPYINIFTDMDDLIDVNEYNTLVDQQLKKDRLVQNVYTTSQNKKDNKLSVIIRKKQTHMTLAKYLHASAFSSVKSTFIKAIKKGFLTSWPGLSANLIKKHLPDMEATVLGHI